MSDWHLWQRWVAGVAASLSVAAIVASTSLAWTTYNTVRDFKIVLGDPQAVQELRDTNRDMARLVADARSKAQRFERFDAEIHAHMAAIEQRLEEFRSEGGGRFTQDDHRIYVAAQDRVDDLQDRRIERLERYHGREQ